MFARFLVIPAMVFLVVPVAVAETIAKTYPIKNVTEFVSGGNTSVEISQDGTEYLRIEADAEIMQRVKVDQSGNRVSVWVKSDGSVFNWFGNNNDPVRIVLRVKQLEYLELSGSAQATLGDIQGEKFQLNISGAGDVNFAALNARLLKMELSGAANVSVKSVNSKEQDYDLSGAADIEIQSASNTQELDVGASGASNFRAKNLTAKQARLGASGASHIEATVTEILDANASGASSVAYYGNPKAKTDASGASHVSAHTDE